MLVELQKDFPGKSNENIHHFYHVYQERWTYKRCSYLCILDSLTDLPWPRCESAQVWWLRVVCRRQSLTFFRRSWGMVLCWEVIRSKGVIVLGHFLSSYLLRWFFTFYHGKSPWTTTIWENIFLETFPSIFIKPKQIQRKNRPYKVPLIKTW